MICLFAGLLANPDIPLSLYAEFIRLLFLYTHRETSTLANELSKESDQFCFLRVSCFANLKVAVGLIMTKSSAIATSI